MLPKILGLAAVYLATAKFGLMMDPVSGFATLVWPPSGIALAALLLLGPGVWPGVLIGAFLINWHVGAPPLVALGMAVGNSCEALLGATLLRRFAKFDPSMNRVTDALALIVIGALLAPVFAASIGAGSLLLGNRVEAAGFVQTWRVWWIGDMLGVLTFTPFLLAWMTPGLRRLTRERALEMAVFAVAFLLACRGVFGWAKGGQTFLEYAYVLFPFVIWSALRFGLRGVTLTQLATFMLGIWGATQGQGPFQMGSLIENLIFLQPLIALISITGLFVASAIAESREAVKTRDTFISLASHELRTPVTGLRLRSDLLLELLEEQPGPAHAHTDRIKSTVSKFDRQIDRLTRLVEDMLDISRINLNKLEIHPEPTDLAALLREMMERLGPELASAGCAVTLRVPESVIGNWDPHRLVQIISNLISNAIRYAPGKPVEISLALSGSGTVLFQVRDQGAGIAMKDQTRIFERFERAAPVNKVGGLGLGLAIVKQLAEAQGGSVRVQSEPGRGACFTVELPV